MNRALVLALVLLTACTATHALRHPRRQTPVPYMLVDAALLSVGACVGLDGQYHTLDAGGRRTKMMLGYGLFAAVWIPLWLVDVR